jgi:hypothetical protein
MVKYMKAMLCEEMPFKNIPTTFYATTFYFESPKQVKGFMSMTLGFNFSIYHEFSLIKICDKFEKLAI